MNRITFMLSSGPVPGKYNVSYDDMGFSKTRFEKMYDVVLSETGVAKIKDAIRTSYQGWWLAIDIEREPGCDGMDIFGDDGCVYGICTRGAHKTPQQLIADVKNAMRELEKAIAEMVEENR